MDYYNLLGRSGLRVSPLSLGAMTFGNAEWGADEETSKKLLARYIDLGGNFVDTANIYAGGASEAFLGKHIEEGGWRDQLVIATKFTGARRAAGDPNAAGNGRKNLRATVQESLNRLRTDHIDLLWLHIWDTVTPVEEVMATLDALVREGTVHAIGFSDVPAWHAARAQTLAQWRGWEPLAALQLDYSLVERNIEYEHVPAALELSMGIVPWSPLRRGLLSGKYTREAHGPGGEGRLQSSGERVNPTDEVWSAVDVLRTVAGEVGCTPAQAALNWVVHRPAVASTIIGVRTVEQLDDNMGALDITLTDEQRGRLDAAAPARADRFPYRFFSGDIARMSMGGTDVRRPTG